MAILIDGYNLLNATGIDGRGTAGRTELERSRVALLNFLANRLSAEERAATTIVFDAAQAPPGLPSELTYAEMQVRFARDYPTADDLIEELITANHTPRQLTVVSSDHRLHRAARRRRAIARDSDGWIAELEQRAHAASSPSETPPPDPDISNSAAAIWLAEFGHIDVAAIEAQIQRESSSASNIASASQTQGEPSAHDEAEAIAPPDTIFPPEFLAAAQPDEASLADDWNPFPPGYAADVEEEEF